MKSEDFEIITEFSVTTDRKWKVVTTYIVAHFLDGSVWKLQPEKLFQEADVR